MSEYNRIVELLGAEGDSLLSHTCTTIPRDELHLTGADWVDRIFGPSDRSIPVLRSLQTLFGQGRLGNTGFLSILPVDQGIEHTGGASFAPNRMYFDPENIVRLAAEAECNGVATTLGVLATVARKYAHRIPFVLKVNHNELMTYPNKHDQIMFASIKQAADMGAVAIGATIYFGAPESNRQLMEVARAFEMAHDQGMATILWCYTRNSGFKKDGTDYHTAADLTGQANHLGATIKADILKQKLPTNNGGFSNVGFGKTHPGMYNELCTDHPIDLVRYQVANGYMGRIGLISSGGASGDNDLQQVARTAVINKRGGGIGLICGRKAFQKPFEEGVNILRTIQDVYLTHEITVA